MISFNNVNERLIYGLKCLQHDDVMIEVKELLKILQTKKSGSWLLEEKANSAKCKQTTHNIGRIPTKKGLRQVG